MQTGKNAVETMKESAANVAASAKSGMEKTKATLQEKTEKMTAHNPMEKESATEIKQEKINQAEMSKQAAMHNNAAAHQHKVQGSTGAVQYTASGDTASYSTTGVPGHSTGLHQMSAMPGRGTRQPMAQVTDGTVGIHPIGVNRGTVGNTTGGTTAHNTRVEGHAPSYGTGGTYS